jgi:hypothetical protein
MVADFAINVRAGGNRQSTAENTPEFIARKTVDALRRQIEAKGVERVLEAIVANEAAIVRDVTRDAERFGGQAARVFTRVKSSPGGTVSISLDDISQRTGTLVSSTDRMSSRLKGKTTVEWLALRKATVDAKRRRMRQKRRKKAARSAGEPETFFVDSGALRATLTDFLGPAMALLVDPKILVRRGTRKVTATMSVMAQASGREKAGLTYQTLPQAYGGATATGSESLFIRYLKRAGAKDTNLGAKLENPNGRHRPFLQNTLVYWISNRMPLVFEKSLKTALAKRVKKVK